MNELLPFLAIDAVVVAAVGAIFVRHASFFHPLSFYLFFHLYSFTLRAWELWSGKWPMYYGMNIYYYYSAVRPEEFIRALLVADGALVLFALGVALATTAVAPRVSRPFNDRLLVGLLATLLPVSFALMIWTRYYASRGTAFEEFQLFRVMTVWPIGLITLAIARWGFRWYWVTLAVVYLVVVGTQGYHRFMLLLPIIMLVGVYLARERRAWPGPALWGLLIAAMLVFPSLKYVGRAFQQKGLVVAVEMVGAFEDNVSSKAGTRTEQFFDQFAGALTLADSGDVLLLGRTYLAVLTLPVPRSLWPNKPSLGESARAVAAPWRPFDVEGRIVTLIGEAYINFRYVGIVIILPLIGWILTRFYVRAFSIPDVDPYKLAYIGLMATYLQVYRDGLNSFILFGLMVTFPLLLYLVLNTARQIKSGVSREHLVLAP